MFFVGVFEILKRERNESKSERKTDEIEKVKQGEKYPWNNFKSYENYNYYVV